MSKKKKRWREEEEGAGGSGDGKGGVNSSRKTDGKQKFPKVLNFYFSTLAVFFLKNLSQ